MWLIVFCLFVAVFMLWTKVGGFDDRIRKIERESGERGQKSTIGRLEDRLRKLERRMAGGPPSIEDSATSSETSDVAAALETIMEAGPPGVNPPEEEQQEAMQPPLEAFVRRPAPSSGASARAARLRTPPTPRGPSPAEQRWKQIETRFIENWTGILGSVVMVAGFTFISGYAGLQMKPIYRTLLLAMIGMLFAFSGWWLLRRERWRVLGLWIRSTGAAVFLFACFASSAVPGLMWLTSMQTALGVLIAGLTVNMALAYMVGIQGFASLHVVLSLTPLVLVPQSITSLVLATLVVGAGLAVALRRRWDLHVGITLTAYLIFHVVWYAKVALPRPDVFAVASSMVVSAVIVAVHLLEHRDTKRLQPLRLAIHVVAWATAGAGVLIYVDQPWIRSSLLLALALAAFSTGRIARSTETRWLHIAGVLIAQSFALAAIISVHHIMFHWLLVPAVLLAQSWLFLRVANQEGEKVLVRVGMYSIHALIVVLAIGGISATSLISQTLRIQLAGVLFGSAGIVALLHADVASRHGQTFDSLLRYSIPSDGWIASLSLSALGAGVLATVALLLQHDGTWLAWSAVGAATILLAAGKRIESPGLSLGALLTVLTACVMTWFTLFGDPPVAAQRQLAYHFPALTLAGLLTIILAASDQAKSFVRKTGVYLLAINLGVFAYTLLQPFSPFIPGVAWLCLAVIALEIANRAPSDSVTPTIHAGLGYLFSFACAYFLVVLQSELRWGFISLREVIEIFALGVLAYWWLYRPRQILAQRGTWRIVHPLFLELGLAFLAVVVVVETPTHWRPLAWMALAWIPVFTGAGAKLDRRFNFYSVVAYWIAAIDLVVVTSSYVMPTSLWFRHPGFTGAVALAAQLAYVALGTPRIALDNISFPAGLSLLRRWSDSVFKHTALWIYYPFFIGTALFLYWRFDATILTLLWSVEAFAVFAVSIALKENHFRYMALAALVACLIRLVVFDLSQANLGLRGLVFLGVGALMLGMNALYNAFKERLS